MAAHHWTGKWHKPCLLLSHQTLSLTATHFPPTYQTQSGLKLVQLGGRSCPVRSGFIQAVQRFSGWISPEDRNIIGSKVTLARWKSRYSISGMIAGQEGDGRELPGMMPKKLLPRVSRRESRCAAAISWPPPGPCSTCRWATLLLPGSRGGGGGGSAATGNSFGFPAWSCSGGGASGHARVAHLIDARVAHLQPEGLPANHREEEKPDQRVSCIKIRRRLRILRYSPAVRPDIVRQIRVR